MCRVCIFMDHSQMGQVPEQLPFQARFKVHFAHAGDLVLGPLDQLRHLGESGLTGLAIEHHHDEVERAALAPVVHAQAGPSGRRDSRLDAKKGARLVPEEEVGVLPGVGVLLGARLALESLSVHHVPEEIVLRKCVAGDHSHVLRGAVVILVPHAVGYCIVCAFHAEGHRRVVHALEERAIGETFPLSADDRGQCAAKLPLVESNGLVLAFLTG